MNEVAPPLLDVDRAPVPAPWLAHVPVTLFGATMGLAGLALAWRRAAALGAPELIGQALFWLALLVYVALATAYLAKVLLHPAAVRAEAVHPVRMAFLPAPGIALVLIAAAGQDLVPGLAEVLWWAGAGGQLVLTVYVVSAWMNHGDLGWSHVTPAWFVPVVGLSAAPLAGAGFAPQGVNAFFLGTGVVFWMALLPLVLGRLFVGSPLPPRLAPTLAVLVAPPAVILLAYLRLVADPFGTLVPRLLLGIAMFFAMLVIAQVPTWVRSPFSVAWWAVSFPLAALTAATTVLADRYNGLLVPAAWTLVVLVSVVVVGLVVRTVRAIAIGALFVPE